MGFPTKIQLIKRSKSEQWYINFPSALAQAMEFERGEVVEWSIENKNKLLLKRNETVTTEVKKKPQTDL
jgi:antitoxin component of MazEF toxin-antitoxin module